VAQRIEAHGVSAAGPRPINEDACLVDVGAGLFVVADGMGGHNAGEVASALAVSTIASTIGASEVREASTLEDAVRRANGRILEAAAGNADYAGMGTTVSAVLVEDGHASLVNVGDSRVYLLREGRLEQLTRDDSWVRQLLDDGAPLSDDDIQRHPMRHVLTEVVGVRPDLLPRVEVHELRSGDVLLLSSDGLHGVLSAEDLQKGLQADGAAGVIAEQLVKRAVAGGATDNVTALVVRVRR
jgi:PPM family protein phosphatase